MLAILMLRAVDGATVSREDARGARDGAEGGNERAVDVQVNRLRRKIESDPASPAFISRPCEGSGYRLLLDP